MFSLILAPIWVSIESPTGGSDGDPDGGPNGGPSRSISDRHLRAVPPKKTSIFLNIKEILEDFPSENFSLEFVERNALHILKLFEPSWLGLPQGRVFFARGFPVFARWGPFMESGAVVKFVEDSRQNRALGIPFRRVEMSIRKHFPF